MRHSQWRTWLRPGMHVKRWGIVLMLGIALSSLAMAMGVTWLYRNYEFPEPVSRIVRALTLQVIPHPQRELVFLIGGLVVIGLAFWYGSRAVVSPLLARRRDGASLAQIVAEHRFGPPQPELRVVAIGGGTGLSTLLRGLKRHNVAITAIVTVADDGGSTGRIREEFHMPAPGDIRNCIESLADNESTVAKLFNYRFDEMKSDLSGHSFGNLFITALTQLTGSFEQAVIESSRVLAVRGRVLPATLANVALCAEMIDGSVVTGETAIAQHPLPIKRVFLSPERPDGYEPALAAIMSADLVVLGPGSLYTSVLPNLLVGGVPEALRWTEAKVGYVCNVATQPGETDHFGLADHVRAILDELGPDVLDFVLVNSNRDPAVQIKPEWGVAPVTALNPSELRMPGGPEIISQDVVDDVNPLRHDPAKLAAALLEIVHASRRSSRRRGPATVAVAEQIA